MNEVEDGIQLGQKDCRPRPVRRRISCRWLINVWPKGCAPGKSVALEAAQARASRGWRVTTEKFSSGAPVAGRQFGAVFEKQFLEAFNLAVCTWYSWKNEQPVEQRIDYARMDESIQWCIDRKLIPKSFGYVYLTNGATPEWFRAWPWEKVLPEYANESCAMTTRRYGAKPLPSSRSSTRRTTRPIFSVFLTRKILELAKAACQGCNETVRQR